jgi:hypothetical protein
MPARDLDPFGAHVRIWLEKNCPPGVRGPGAIPEGTRAIPLTRDPSAARHGLHPNGGSGGGPEAGGPSASPITPGGPGFGCTAGGVRGAHRRR